MIEDNDTLRKLLGTVVEGLGGITVYGEETCQSAWEAICRGEYRNLDFIIMDIYTPGVTEEQKEFNGKVLLKRMREKEGFKTIPIITMSSWPETSLEQELLWLGASSHIEKASSLIVDNLSLEVRKILANNSIRQKAGIRKQE